MAVWLRSAGAALAFASLCGAAEIVQAVEVAGSRAPFELATRAGEPIDQVKLRQDVKRLWGSGRFEDVRVESTEDATGLRLVFRLKEKRPLRLRKVEVHPPTAGVQHGLAPDAFVDPQRAQEAAAAVRAQLVAQGYPEARVTAKLAPVDSGRADVTLAVNKGKHVRIGKVEFTGEPGADPRELRKALQATRVRTMLPGVPWIWSGWKLRPGYSEDAIDADAAALRSLLFSKGFFAAAVRRDAPEYQPDGTLLRFRIDSGPRYAVRSLDVHPGGGGLRAILPGPGGQFPKAEVCGAFFDERRKAERAGVVDFGARLQITELPDGAAGQKRADLDARVELGPAYRVGRIEFRGNRGFGDLAIRRSLLLDEGQPLDQMLLRKTLGRMNRTGLFEPLSPANVVVNTAPGADIADLTIHVTERKRGHWALSGPVGPLSVAGPLRFSVGSRLPSWGRGIFDLSTYTASISLMAFAQPLAGVLPFLPDRRFMVLGTLGRPLLPGQRLTSGFTIAPQLGWQGMLAGYGVTQSRDLLGGLFESERTFTPPIEVKITRGTGPDAPIEGVMVCELPATKMDRLRKAGAITTGLLFSMSPF
ncbi:MAG TPA: POTRA domain-containing protein [Bryobacteraceae bacterium]|nr:POTRA domain-containing protein [Bryobacteraceae bacterium]